VFGADGGFWFTDHGIREERTRDRTGIYYAAADGSLITEVAFPTDSPNGIGLSPDGSTLYWAETHTGRVFHRTVAGPGELTSVMPLDPSVCLCGLPGLQLLDSLAIDVEGNICVATLINGGITVVSPSGEVVDFVATGDPLTTNICFGGDDLCTAFITLSGTGRLVSTRWPRPGLALRH
jgi:gluconolactonase